MLDHAKPLQAPESGKDVVLHAVIKDLELRAVDGKKKYGTLLETHNGRNALVDALQESYDQSMYLKQALMEYDDVRAMACENLWKDGSENPTREGFYPVILADTKGYTTEDWSTMEWNGISWELGIFSEGVTVKAWFDIPPYQQKEEGKL